MASRILTSARGDCSLLCPHPSLASTAGAGVAAVPGTVAAQAAIRSPRLASTSSASSAGTTIRESSNDPLSAAHSPGASVRRFIGKALQDERLLDLPLSPVLCKLLLGHPLTLHDVAAVDPVLGRSLLEMQRMANGTHKTGKLKEYLEALHLDFTLPGAHW